MIIVTLPPPDFHRGMLSIFGSWESIHLYRPFRRLPLVGLPVSLLLHILSDLGKDSSLLLSHPVDSGIVLYLFRNSGTSHYWWGITAPPKLSAVWTFLRVPDGTPWFSGFRSHLNYTINGKKNKINIECHLSIKNCDIQHFSLLQFKKIYEINNDNIFIEIWESKV